MEGVQMNQINNTRMLEMMRGTPPPTWEQTCLKLSSDLADSRQHVTQLENRLRALWDKLEYERKHYMEQINRTESFINRFLDPEDLGYTVNNYVRDDAREALGRERVEAKP
jgi:hypothetical protein